jgi:uncharacterized protein (TIGR02466 family)
MFEIFPLFPSVVSANVIQEDLSWFKSILEKIEYASVNKYDSNLSYASTDMNILEKYPKIKSLILHNFNHFKDTVLKLESTNFKISTSWVTNTFPGGYSHAHTHKNSVYSGVLYFDDCDFGGNLLFENYGIRTESFMLNDPSEWNFYNIENFEIKPKKNLIVYFPSYLRHRVTTHIGSKNRYSLAINFFPIGKLGYGDSAVEIS